MGKCSVKMMYNEILNKVQDRLMNYLLAYGLFTKWTMIFYHVTVIFC